MPFHVTKSYLKIIFNLQKLAVIIIYYLIWISHNNLLFALDKLPVVYLSEALISR